MLGLLAAGVRLLRWARPTGSAGGDWLLLRLLVGAVSVAALSLALVVGVVHAFVADRLRALGRSRDGA